MTSTISEQAKSNIDEIEQELETSSAIFQAPTRQDIHDQIGSDRTIKYCPCKTIASKIHRVNRLYDMNAKLLMSTTEDSNCGILQKQPACR